MTQAMSGLFEEIKNFGLSLDLKLIAAFNHLLFVTLEPLLSSMSLQQPRGKHIDFWSTSVPRHLNKIYLELRNNAQSVCQLVISTVKAKKKKKKKKVMININLLIHLSTTRLSFQSVSAYLQIASYAVQTVSVTFHAWVLGLVVYCRLKRFIRTLFSLIVFASRPLRIVKAFFPISFCWRYRAW